MRLVFLGPPGAGKGTQAQELSQQRGWPHISTGDLLRAARASNSELGRKAQSYMDAGQLVPDSLICEVVAERLKQKDCATGWILDGFPRTRGQADALEATLRGLGQGLDRCVYFHIDFEELTERLVGRLTCKSCGALFHRTFKPAKVAGKCDVCGGELFQRPDDQEETVRKRLSVYAEQTKELVPYYSSKRLLAQIEAQGTPDEVRTRLVSALGGK